MPVVQSTYSATIPIGLEGQIADMATSNSDTKICETVAGIGFGRVVSTGAAARGVILGGAAFYGISVRDITLQHLDADLDKYLTGENMQVLTMGDIWVKPTVGVTQGTPAAYDTTTGQLNVAGTAIAGSRWLTTALANAMALLRLTRTAP
jgi:hypothetical protein